MTVLGISLGTKRTGICVLQDDTVLDANVHRYDDQWSDTKLHLIITRYRQYVRRYGVTAIIIKIPPLKMHTAAVRKLMKKVEALAKQCYCEFDLITKKEIKLTLCLASSGEIANYVKEKYPDLTVSYEKGVRNEQINYKKLYEAVLSAHIYQERLRRRALSNANTTE